VANFGASKVDAGQFPNGTGQNLGRKMSELKQTALHELHLELGAKMVPFAGYDMPVQYAAGVLKEHLLCRAGAGLFDVSHMGQVVLRAKSGDNADAARALESLMPMDVLGLPAGRQRYGFFTNDAGGIEDDLMIANRGDHLFLVVNAACKGADFELMKAGLGDVCSVEMIKGRSLLALQGPKAPAALAKLVPEVTLMQFMDVEVLRWLGVELWISRSGYTGEDGYEISVPDAFAADFARTLLEMDGVEPIGLGARDSLRLEAGLCLYGNDIDSETTPVEASLNWAIQKVRRTGGDRAGGFPGADRILNELSNGAARKRIGVQPQGRAPMRGGTVLFSDQTSENPIGGITSGGFGPTIEGPMAIGYVSKENATIGTTIYADVRGKRLPATVVKMPFTPANFKR
jgi:aminomethyltransferase